MKKVLANVTKYIFGLFGIAIIGLLMSLTYQAMQRVFPNNFGNQMWGLVLFDIAAICWALAFVFHCQSTGQYAVSAIGFAAGFLGTLGMVAAEVLLSGQTLTPDQAARIAQWIVYIFIGATILQAALIYAHHGSAPDIREKIDVGIARGEIVTEAIKQATASLDTEKANLAATMRNEIIDQVKRDLDIPILADSRMPIIPASPTTFQYPYQTGREPIISQVPHPTNEVCQECGFDVATKGHHHRCSQWHGFQTPTPKDEPTSARVPFQPE